MPGPGPHLMYAMSSGLALTHLTKGRFTPHHTLTYTLNAFFGPDIGSFSEWLSSTLFAGSSFVSSLADAIHHPFYYVLILGLPLCVFYSWVSSILVKRSVLDSVTGIANQLSRIIQVEFLSKLHQDRKKGAKTSDFEAKSCLNHQTITQIVPLSRRQCLLLISAGSLSHFFLDHLFEWLIGEDGVTVVLVGHIRGPGAKMDQWENGHSSMYTWILSTGWWINRAPVNPDAVMVVGLLCTCLIGGFIYINRTRLTKSTRKQSYQSMKLILIIASLYCLWCASQVYWVNPRRPAVGEEADLGVLVFLATYFLLPHCLCILSMNSEDIHTEQLPL
ncbi:hypothetical protein QUC31_006968 [Theobroma cacao]